MPGTGEKVNRGFYRGFSRNNTDQSEIILNENGSIRCNPR